MARKSTIDAFVNIFMLASNTYPPLDNRMPNLKSLLNLFVIALPVLAGCTDYVADHAHAQTHYHRLIGQPITAATAIFGPPDVTSSGTKGRLYLWTNAPKSVLGEYLKNSDSQSHRTVETYGYMPPSAYCWMNIVSGFDNVVRGIKMQGEYKSCHEFDEKWNERFPDYPNGKWVSRYYYKDPQ